MRRTRPTPLLNDEQTHVARLRGLLGLLEEAEANGPARTWPTREAMEAAGFVIDRPYVPPDPFLGRRLVNEVMERDRRRQARKAAKP